MKLFSDACARNRDPILQALTRLFADRRRVLEIGSGSGQHAAYFAKGLPHLVWQPSDLPENLPSIRAWRAEAQASNLLAPLVLDVFSETWSVDEVDAIFCANILHIVAWKGVEAFFMGVGRVLMPGGRLCVYGPFNYQGRYTSDSNAQFDHWLKARDPESGIRGMEAIQALARAQGLSPVEDLAMPANNRLVTWSKESPP